MTGRNVRAAFFPIVLLLAVVTPAVAQQDVIIGDMSLDRMAWGKRVLHIPAENLLDDTARVSISIQTVYPGHYLSGLERLSVDTTVILPPNKSDELLIPFEIAGSFGRVATRAWVTWQFNHYQMPSGSIDSASQTFINVYKAKGDAVPYGARKHSIGPVYSVMDHFLMNFEYPRLVLFLLAQGETADSITVLFEAERDYTRLVVDRLRGEGFFPLASDSLAPGIVAITETEAYAIKDKVQPGLQAFTAWYEGSGRDKTAKILREAGMGDDVHALPAVQLPFLLTLLEQPWVDDKSGFDVMQFEKPGRDMAVQNQPRWIVQGGEFFLPKLCVGVFLQDSVVHVGTFNPNPSLPFDKACIYDMRKAVEQAVGSIASVEAAQFRKALQLARQQNLVADFAPELKKVVAAAKADVGSFRPYQEPYLADYVCRVILGGYFVSHKPAQGLDCVRVIY